MGANYMRFYVIRIPKCFSAVIRFFINLFRKKE